MARPGTIGSVTSVSVVSICRYWTSRRREPSLQLSVHFKSSAYLPPGGPALQRKTVDGPNVPPSAGSRSETGAGRSNASPLAGAVTFLPCQPEAGNAVPLVGGEA